MCCSCLRCSCLRCSCLWFVRFLSQSILLYKLAGRPQHVVKINPFNKCFVKCQQDKLAWKLLLQQVTLSHTEPSLYEHWEYAGEPLTIRANVIKNKSNAYQKQRKSAFSLIMKSHFMNSINLSAKITYEYICLHLYERRTLN